MIARLMEKRITTAVFVSTVAVFAYLGLGGPLPGPVGERHGTYLEALFCAVLSPQDLAALVVRSSLIFMLAFGLSWVLLALMEHPADRGRPPERHTAS